MRNNLVLVFNLMCFLFSLSGNKGLCGVPSLPACPIFWENGRLSTRGKIAIGLSCLFVFCMILLLVYIYIRRRRNDYDFALPHELTGNYDFKKILFLSSFIFFVFCGISVVLPYLLYQCGSFSLFCYTSMHHCSSN